MDREKLDKVEELLEGLFSKKKEKQSKSNSIKEQEIKRKKENEIIPLGDKWEGRKNNNSKFTQLICPNSQSSKYNSKVFINSTTTTPCNTGRVHRSTTNALPNRTHRSIGSLNTTSADRKNNDTSKKMFLNTVKDIKKLVYPEMDKAYRTTYDALQLKLLGGKALKNEKVPYNVLLKRKEREVMRLQQLREQEAELGVKLSISRKGNPREATSAKRRQAKTKRDRRRDGKLLGFRVGAPPHKHTD